MNSFLISFELRDPSEANHESVYRWVHNAGGYRYVQMGHGQCGELPGTCVVYQSLQHSESIVLSEFVERVSADLGIKVSGACVMTGVPKAVCALKPCPIWLQKSANQTLSNHAVFGIARNIASSPTIS